MKTKAQDKVEKMTVKGRETIAQEQKKVDRENRAVNVE